MTTYSPNQRYSLGFLACFTHAVREIRTQPFLIGQLFKRDFLSYYKRSFLGASWVLLGPLTAALSWVFLNLTHVLQPGPMDVPYPAYVLVGTTIWSLFVRTTSSVAGVLVNSRHIIVNTNMPRSVLIAVQILVAPANFAVSLVLALVLLLAFGVHVSPWIGALPVIVLPLLLCATAIGLVGAVIGAISYDLNRAVMGAIGLALFVTPVVYAPTAMHGMLGTIVSVNPLTYLLGAARDAVVGTPGITGTAFLMSTVGSVLALGLAWRFFHLTEERLIERLG